MSISTNICLGYDSLPIKAGSQDGGKNGPIGWVKIGDDCTIQATNPDALLALSDALIDAAAQIAVRQLEQSA